MLQLVGQERDVALEVTDIVTGLPAHSPTAEALASGCRVITRTLAVNDDEQLSEEAVA